MILRGCIALGALGAVGWLLVLAGCGDDRSGVGARPGKSVSEESPAADTSLGTPKTSSAATAVPPKDIAPTMKTEAKKIGSAKTESKTADPKKEVEPKDVPAPPKAKEKVAVLAPKKDEKLPPAVMPKVVMSAEHAEACLVKVGQVLPEVSLTTGKDTQQPLSELYGKKATVVFFWNSDNIYSLQELRDLDRDLVARYGKLGVAVIGINVGQSISEAQRAIAAAGAKFPQRFDPKRAAMAKIATKHLPRTYVLDAKGKIVWLDSEYSTFTRRELRTAVRAVLGK
jgi:peroxiredoxin